MTSIPAQTARAKEGEANPFARVARPLGLRRWLPIILLIQTYQRDWLLKDLIAGLALTAVLVPVGMGYAEASGLPAIYGLYSTIVPLVAYALFGPSRILVLGPDSALAGIIAATIIPLAAGNPDRLVALAGLLALLTGALCIVAGLARFGFLTDLLSKPIRYGYLNGIALTVLVGQLPKILGFTSSGGNLIREAGNLVQGIMDNQTNGTALVIGLASLIVIAGFKWWAPSVPDILIAVSGATLVVELFDLRAQNGLMVVGPLPKGLPVFNIPMVSPDELGTLFASALAIALVAFADMSVLSRTFALRGKYVVDRNQELIALGAANVAAGLFQGFSISSSASRTPVAESAGAKSQLAGFVGAACIALLLIFVPKLLQNMPTAALGAVVISACFTLVEISAVFRLYHLRRGEFVLSIVCFLGVALIGVIQGILLAVGLALMNFIWHAWRPYDAVLGRVDGLKGYHDITRHPEAKRIPGLILFRWDAPLFFANAEIFREHVLQAIAEAPTRTKWVVIAAEPVTDIDITAADILTALDEALHSERMELCFAEMKGPVKDQLKRYGIFTTFGTENFFATLGQAVDRYLDVHQIKWQDWDD
jgi:high affinity sulfate transporter 1